MVAIACPKAMFISIVSNIQIYNLLWPYICQQVYLKHEVQNSLSQILHPLETDILNASGYFSAGQKQFICLDRALICGNKLLVLDQATSNIDMKTDEFIQNVIREHFKDTTVTTIAHRLNRVPNYDSIVVMHGARKNNRIRFSQRIARAKGKIFLDDTIYRQERVIDNQQDSGRKKNQKYYENKLTNLLQQFIGFDLSKKIYKLKDFPLKKKAQ